MIGQLSEELVKALTKARLQIKTKPEVEMTHPKIYMEPELRGREVCQQPSGFMSNWLQCSLYFDKYYPKRVPSRPVSRDFPPGILGKFISRLLTGKFSI